MGKSKIEWTDEVWNPVTGCTKVSAGCKNCYAERMFHRPYPGRDFTDVRCHPERLDAPLHWRKPRRVFVNSMSDLFHESVPRDFIDAVWSTMAEAKQHTFQILTKRPQRMMEFMLDRQRKGWKADWKNVWLGVSVEDQATADERIPLLLQTPAAVRFVSAEPLLGQINLASTKGGTLWIGGQRGCAGQHHGIGTPECPRELHHHHDNRCKYGLDWLIAGGESGPNARPSHPDWFRSLRDQCYAVDVPFFFKQWGEWLPVEKDDDGLGPYVYPVDGSDEERLQDMGPRPLQKLDHQYMSRVGKKKAGNTLDGKQHLEYPMEGMK